MIAICNGSVLTNIKIIAPRLSTLLYSGSAVETLCYRLYDKYICSILYIGTGISVYAFDYPVDEIFGDFELAFVEDLQTKPLFLALLINLNEPK